MPRQTLNLSYKAPRLQLEFRQGAIDDLRVLGVQAGLSRTHIYAYVYVYVCTYLYLRAMYK